MFADALVCVGPAVLPPADTTLTSLKDASYDKYLSCLKLPTKIMDAIWKLAEKATKVGCDSGSPIACAMKERKYYSQIQEQFTALLSTRASTTSPSMRTRRTPTSTSRWWHRGWRYRRTRSTVRAR